MPIKGYGNMGRLPRLGKIHLGVKVESKDKPGVFYPKAVDYFVCPPEVQGVYGEKPKKLRIMFLTNNIDSAASLYYRAYKATTGLVCKGDGETARATVDSAQWAAAKGEVKLGIWASSKSTATERVEIPCAGEGYEGCVACPAFEHKDCKRLLMLQFAVLGVPRLGVYQIDTGSFFGIVNVNGFLDMLQTVLGGRIAGLPLTLEIIPQEVSPDGKKKVVNVLRLSADVSIEEFLQLAARPVAEVIAAGGHPALPAPAAQIEAPVESDIIEGEIQAEPPDESTIPFEDLPVAEVTEEEQSLEQEVDAQSGQSGPPPAPPVTPAVDMACAHLPQGEVNRRWRKAGDREDWAVCICCGGPAKKPEGDDPPRCVTCSEE